MRHSKKALNNFISEFNKEPDKFVEQIKEELKKIK